MMNENEAELFTKIETHVKEDISAHLFEKSWAELSSLDLMESLIRRVAVELVVSFYAVWNSVLEAAALQLAKSCPRCGRFRKCKRRPKEPMHIKVLGLAIQVPKLYLECGHCDAPGVSITKVLTGLTSGDASVELKLMAAYTAAEHSYGKASRALKVHHGQEVERTSVRRMALEVEKRALEYAEEQRVEALKKVSSEAKTEGVERLMLQGDGGSVRTGRLVDCAPGDEGYKKTTPKTGKPRRKRVTKKREVITLDVREPGQMEPKGLDVVVPCDAAEGERAMRMLAMAARSGLGDNTQVLGLGDLGSNLPSSFDEAFVGYNSIYSGDWKHVRNYVEAAAAVLTGPEVDLWEHQMLDAIWERDEVQRDRLLQEAHERRMKELPEKLERCPVHALKTYLRNNWERMQAALFKQMGVDFVSARAEAQVRDRTKDRFSMPGAWRQENLEGKATLRAIIDEGSFQKFRKMYHERERSRFQKQLIGRLEKAVREGRLSVEQKAEALDDRHPTTLAS